MGQRRIGQTDGGRTHFDARTGEVLEEGYTAYVVPKRKNGFGTRWMAMAQDPAMLLAKRDDLGTEEFRVFMALVSKLDFENLLVVNQAEIAREIGMHRQHVNHAIKRLIEIGVLLEGPRIGINRSYRFNPNFGWKGSAKNHVIALDAERNRRMKSARITDVLEGGKKAPKAKTKEAEPEKRDDRTLEMFQEDAGV